MTLDNTETQLVLRIAALEYSINQLRQRITYLESLDNQRGTSYD